jgi:anti-anti-sigma factor
MSIALSQTEKDGSRTQIALGSSIDIGSAAELKTALLSAIASGKQIQIVAEDVSDFDVTALQLLWAAHREAQRAGLKFTVTGTSTRVLENSLTELGMEAWSCLASSRAD